MHVIAKILPPESPRSPLLRPRAGDVSRRYTHRIAAMTGVGVDEGKCKIVAEGGMGDPCIESFSTSMIEALVIPLRENHVTLEHLSGKAYSSSTVSAGEVLHLEEVETSRLYLRFHRPGHYLLLWRNPPLWP